MIKLNIKQVLYLHEKMAETTGGAVGVRDIGLIESAVNQIDQTFAEEELYPTIEKKAARLAHSLISNHGFVDGNKRIGIYAMLVFLELNEIKLNFSQQELIDLGLGTASGSLKYEHILDFISNHN